MMSWLKESLIEQTPHWNQRKIVIGMTEEQAGRERGLWLREDCQGA